jgi:hypothetical protein
LPGTGIGGTGRYFFNEYRVSVCKRRVLEIHDSCGSIVTGMSLALLSCTLNNSEDGKFYVYFFTIEERVKRKFITHPEQTSRVLKHGTSLLLPVRAPDKH